MRKGAHMAIEKAYRLPLTSATRARLQTLLEHQEKVVSFRYVTLYRAVAA